MKHFTRGSPNQSVISQQNPFVQQVLLWIMYDNPNCHSTNKQTKCTHWKYTYQLICRPLSKQKTGEYRKAIKKYCHFSPSSFFTCKIFAIMLEICQLCMKKDTFICYQTFGWNGINIYMKWKPICFSTSNECICNVSIYRIEHVYIPLSSICVLFAWHGNHLGNQPNRWQKKPNRYFAWIRTLWWQNIKLIGKYDFNFIVFQLLAIQCCEKQCCEMCCTIGWNGIYVPAMCRITLTHCYQSVTNFVPIRFS